MSRKKSIVYAKPQEYDIGNGVTVTITYPIGMRPKMQHLDTIVIVGDHVCGADPLALAASPEGPSLAEIRDFQRRREEPVRKKPLTSEDITREQGFNPQAISFENLSGIAAQMPPVVAEDSIVE